MRRSLMLLATVVAMLVLAAPAGAFRLGRAPLPVADNPADHLVDLAPDPEVYDPATNTWTKTPGNMSAARGHHTATLLRSGKVLLAGGLGTRGILGSAEVYDPAAGTFTATGTVPLPRLSW